MTPKALSIGRIFPNSYSFNELHLFSIGTDSITLIEFEATFVKLNPPSFYEDCTRDKGDTAPSLVGVGLSKSST